MNNDHNDKDIEDSDDSHGDRSFDSDDTRRGQTSAFSMHRGARVSSSVRGSSIHTRPVGTSGASLTRGKVDELLLDQRIFIEMRHRIVKLEIVQHVTSKFTTL